MTARLRPELETLPSRLRTLPVDDRGYPVPWFVAWRADGQPEFRAMDPEKWIRAVRDRRCWVCGGALGQYLAFVIGPMCGINRTTAEPACHLECAEWSARNCPFLTRPHMVRREDDEINTAQLAVQSAGMALARNPGVALIWITKSFHVFDDGTDKPLIHLGNPLRTLWYSQGRRATREEVIASVESGLPSLLTIAQQEDREQPFANAEHALMRMKTALESWYPPAVSA